MSEHADLRDAIAGTRSTVKSLIRTARGCLGVLTDLEERLDALDNAQPEEAQRDEHSESDAADRRFAVAS